jgi:glycosyltransferase involved in cell wall biosynthesis
MSLRPRISVLIPTYNRASFLSATLGSVFAQSVPVDEVILVDDGSTDSTVDAVDSLLLQHPRWRTRLRCIRQENQGKSVALNTALEHAQGDLIAFLDSDDTWMPEKLEWQLHALSKFPECGACFTDAVTSHAPDLQRTELQANRWRYPECFLPTDSAFGKIQNASLLFCRGWAGIYMQSVVVRRTAMKECGPFDSSLRLGQDVDFLFRLGLVTTFCYVSLPLVEIHRDPERTLGLTTNYPPISVPRLSAHDVRMCKWLLLIGDSRPVLSQAIKHDLASVRSATANAYLASNDPTSARQVLRKGVRECFEWRLLVKWLMTCLMPSLVRRLAR